MIFHPKLQEEHKQVEGFWGKKKKNRGNIWKNRIEETRRVSRKDILT